MKYFTAILLFLSFYVHGQQTHNSSQGVPGLVIAFVKGHSYEEKIEASVFRNAVANGELELALSDTSYKIIKFIFTWDDMSSTIYEVTNTGPKLNTHENVKKFATAPDNAIVTFDNIVIQKKRGTDTARRYAKAFAVTLSDAATAKHYKENLALCNAYLKGLQNIATLNAGSITTDLVLELSDPSYQLVSFELHIDRIDMEMETLITGNTIRLEKNDVTRTLKSLKPGCWISIQHIKVYKNGKLYEVPPIGIGVK
jgi:hypothetical protein